MGKPGILWSMGLQRFGFDLATDRRQHYICGVTEYLERQAEAHVSPTCAVLPARSPARYTVPLSHRGVTGYITQQLSWL